MITITLELPERVLAALRLSPADFPGELRLAAAVTWYEDGKASREVATQIGGMCRTDFLLALARTGRGSFRIDSEDLDREFARG